MHKKYEKFNDFLDSYYYQLAPEYAGSDEKIWQDFVAHNLEDEVHSVLADIKDILQLPKEDIQNILNKSGNDIYMEKSEDSYNWLLKLKDFIEKNLSLT